MRLTINRIAVKPLALVVGGLQAGFGLFLGIIVAMGSLFNDEPQGVWRLGIWAFLVLPVLNALLGIVTGACIAGGYNVLSMMIGKIEIEVEEAKIF